MEIQPEVELTLEKTALFPVAMFITRAKKARMMKTHARKIDGAKQLMGTGLVVWMHPNSDTSVLRAKMGKRVSLSYALGRGRVLGGEHGGSDATFTVTLSVSGEDGHGQIREGHRKGQSHLALQAKTGIPTFAPGMTTQRLKWR